MVNEKKTKETKNKNIKTKKTPKFKVSKSHIKIKEDKKTKNNKPELSKNKINELLNKNPTEIKRLKLQIYYLKNYPDKREKVKILEMLYIYYLNATLYQNLILQKEIKDKGKESFKELINKFAEEASVRLSEKEIVRLENERIRLEKEEKEILRKEQEEIERIKTEEEEAKEKETIMVEGVERPKSWKHKDFIREIRGLLKDYPAEIDFKDGKDTPSLAHNIFLIYNLLHYCKEKSKKDNLRDEIKEEINLMKTNINMNELIIAYRNYFTIKINYNKHRRLAKIDDLINKSINFINEKIQFYILAIPIAGKTNMSLKHTHGLGAINAEEFESSEIEEGEKIREGQTFSLNEEGGIMPSG